jgi:hypothetical protein
MKCEFCNKRLQSSEILHGIRYGAADGATDLFIPARDSAWTVICATCGENIYKIIYQKFNKNTTYQPIRTFQNK